jgi:hypothetical protein
MVQGIAVLRILALLICLTLPARAFFPAQGESLISSCVAVWTAWDYDPVNNRYPNIGQSQNGTNLFMVEDGNSVLRPTRLIGNGYLWMPGQNNNSASITNATAYNLTNDFEIRLDAALDSWASGNLASKSFNTPQRTWEMTCTSSKFALGISTNGTGLLPNTQSAAHGLAAGQRMAVRVTVGQVNDNIVMTWYTNTDINALNWTQLGSPVTNLNTRMTNIFNSDSRVYLGAVAGANSAKGKFYGFQIRQPIGGSNVVYFDSTLCGQTGYTDTNCTPNAVWTLNRGTYPLSLRQPTSMAVWLPNPAASNYLACVSSSLLSFGAATNGSIFAVAMSHGGESNRRLVNKRTTGSTDAGYELKYAGSAQPSAIIADGTHSATGSSSAPTPASDTMVFLMLGLINSNVVNSVDGTNGTAPINRTPTLSIDSSTMLYLMGSASTGQFDFAQCELVGAGICKRTLTTNEQIRLKQEIINRGNRNATSTNDPGFPRFKWPAGTNITGPYPLVPTIVNATVSAPNSSAATEGSIPSHKYSHHTGIAAQALSGGGYMEWVAFSSNATNETDGGMQTAVCYSTDKGVTWSAPLLAVPSQSNWQLSQPTNIVGSRYAYPRNFTLYNGTNYLIIGVDDLLDTGGDLHGAALYAIACNTNGTLGTLFRISSAACPTVDGKTVPAYDSTLGPPLMIDSKIYGVWGGSTPNPGAPAEWTGWQQALQQTYVEPTTFSVDGGATKFYRIWRGLNNFYSSQAYTTDAGTNWTIPYPTEIPNTPSETRGLRLTDGRFAILGNPVSSSGTVYRDPLFLALTAANSVVVTNVYAIRQGISKDPIYAGYGKSGGASYVSAVQIGNHIHAAYSLEKETIGMSNFLIPGLAEDNN